MGSKQKGRAPRQGNTMKRPTISACMIVRDEEANLERCLKSVRSVADEIVVVDTGSRDGTVEIARRYGAKVSHFEWCDDFAAARNAALENATGDWILQIDADEELTPEAASKMRKVVSGAKSRCWGFHVPERVHYMREGIPAFNLAYRLLLFRNHPKLRYCYRIHENILYTGEGPKPEFLFTDDLVVEHHGYMLGEEQLKEKQERNRRLLLQVVKDEPDDPFHQFNLGKHYYGTGKPAEAVEPLQRAVTQCRDATTSYLVDAYAMLAVALSQTGRGDEVPAVIAEAEGRLPVLTADFLCSAGSAYQASGQLEQALAYFQRAIDAGKVRTASGSDPGTHTWRPRFGIGIINEAMGNLERARSSYEEALTFFPTSPLLHCRMAKVTARSNQPEQALEHVKRALQADIVLQELLVEMLEVCEVFADAVAAGRISLADIQEVGAALVQRIEPTVELGARLSGACSRFGQHERGIIAASATLEKGEDVMARVNRGFCYFALGRYQEAADDFDAAIAAAPDDPSILANVGSMIEQLQKAEAPPLKSQPGVASQAGDAPRRQSLNDVCLMLYQQQKAYGWLNGKATFRRPSSEATPATASNDDGLLASIILAVSDGVARTQRCLEAIIENTPENAYEVVIVDNGSTDGIKDFLKLLDGDVRIITSQSRLSFEEACAQGARAAEGQYLVFLNNDAQPQKDWLAHLVASAESEAPGGTIDAKLVYPFGTAQETGGTTIKKRAPTPRSRRVAAPKYYDFARPEVQALVPHSARRILDVGCASGALGRALKEGQGCEVIGIECVPEVAAIARSRLDRVHVGDAAAVAPSLPEAYFDCIIVADVLEHLAEPAALLSALRRSLAPNGRLILSVPNVRHWSVIRGLLEGRWDYAEAGLLDRTHLRFFTRRTIEELLRSTGFRPMSVQATSINYDPVPANVVEALSMAGLDVASLVEEGGVYQFLYLAEPLPQSITAPLTSIIILTHNQLQDTRLCLDSIERCTPEPHEIIVVDNNSTDGTLDYLRDYMAAHKNVRVIANTTNRGFAAGNNQGLALARGEYRLLLNNDTIVTPGWLGRMLSVFERHPQAGIVGPMSNYVSGPQLATGVKYTTVAEMEALAAALAEANAGQSVPFRRIVGFCLLARKAVIERIGGLDERFGTGNFEDDDFCIRAALAGFEARIARNVFVHHTGGQTFAGAKIDFARSMRRNWGLFKAKWGIAADALLEDGYSISLQPGDASKYYVPLPDVDPGIQLRAGTAEAVLV